MTYDFATRIKRIEAELMALKIATGSGQGATVYDSEITLTQGGETKGSFTLNQATAETIELDAGGGSEPNDGTLTIQKNGTTLETFSADQATNVTANITVPTTVAELSDASNYVQDSDLATVATTGSYSDLTNKPTIGNATLTIQKNGTNVQTFTANSTTAKTANITVPTTVAELSDASDYVKDSDLATVATTGSYSSLTGRPTIGSGTLTVTMDGTTAGTFSANATSNSTIALTSSGSVAGSRIYYATCSTSGGDDAKIATTTDGDFTLETGATVIVRFTDGFNTGLSSLSVDGTGSKSVLMRGASFDARNFYGSNETIAFVYDGTAYEVVDANRIAPVDDGPISDGGYGLTRLSESTSSSSTTHAATSSAVKAAYDLAAAKSVVSYSPTLTSGTVVGALTINGVASTLYAPTLPTLATVATTGDYEDLTNAPTIGDATLTIQKNGSTVQTFTANSTTAKTANITVPTTVAELSDASDYVKDSDLATVATTGDYDDLTDKPTIGSGTLTVTMDGTTAGTFSANATSDNTIALTSADPAGSSIYYATCSTAASTVAKVATTVDGDFVLETGATVTVYFTHYNSADSPTLNVDNTGAKGIRYINGSVIPKYYWRALEAQTFTYNGTYWIADGGIANTTYYGKTKLSSSVSSTSTSLAATPSAVKTAYDLANSKSAVSFTQGLSSGSVVGELDIDGTTTTLYAPSSSGGSTVSYTPTVSSGTALGDLEIDGTTSTIYAPTIPALADVATSGDYSDLSNTPTIGDATLTIQKNGTDVQTFTANSTTAKTANITVPTTVAELTDASDYVQSSDLATVATSGSYSDLTNRPTIGNATLTIQKNGTNVQTFTANSTTAKTANITVPTTVAELSDASDYVKDSDLATVATSGSYSDLSNKPTIGNATLTIQKNGTNVQTFTANSTSSKTANITVPTTVAELSDSSDYVKDSDLATVATSGSYDDLTDKPSDNLVFHGTCSTATGTLAKVATLDDATGFALAEGVMVSITFTNSNLAKDATLNVNSTGATYIVDRSLANDYIRDGAAIWQSGETVLFVYSSSGEWERVSGTPTYLESGGAWNFSVGNVLIQSGQVNASSSATGDISVTFNTEYAATPHIFLTNQFNESGASLWWSFIKSASTTGFTLRSGYTSVTGTGGGGNSSSIVQWLAIGRIKGAV